MDQFPEVIRLNVGGYHFTTLLTTLKKHKDSQLAAMFSGQSPVYKDKDGQYFLDGDGKIFQNILDYLRTDTLPFEELSMNAGLFGGSGGSNDRLVSALHKEALKFGLKDLATHLEKFKGMFVERQLESFRSSIEGYDNIKEQILSAIPVTSMLGSSRTIVFLVSEVAGQPSRYPDFSTCRLNYPTYGFSFNPPISQDDVVSVKVPFNVDHTLLNCLYLDFTKQGFNINNGAAECNFYNEKGPINLFGAATNQRPYNRELIYYIQFNWNLAPSQPLFANQGFTFGGTNNKGFSLGGGSNQGPFSFGAGFGNQNQNQAGSNSVIQPSKFGASLFGSQSNQGGAFGSQDNTNTGGLFGNKQAGSQAFGSQGSGFSFGSPQQQSSAQSGGIFGSQPIKGFGFGSAGSNQDTNQKTLFGTPTKQSQSGGPLSFGAAPSLGNPSSSFGQAQGSTTGFGQATGFGKAAPSFGQATASLGFGQSSAGFGQTPSFGQVPATQEESAVKVAPVAPLFGQTPAFGATERD